MEIKEDSFKARGLRKQLVKELQKKGITNSKVLSAILQVPRHYFFDNIFLAHAYEDKAFPIGEGQTISQPYTVAFQTSLLPQINGAKILEIGTGSGYQAAVLHAMGYEVYSIEYNENLYNKTRIFLNKLGLPMHLFWGDGSKGLDSHAPFDGILVTAGAPSVPQALISQLKINGVLIIPVGNRKNQQMLKITKTAENKITKRTFDNFAFVPLLGQEGWKQ